MAANFGPSLVAIVAAASTIVVLITFLRFWKPKRVLNAQGEDITSQARQKFDHSAGHTFKAWLPWLVLSVGGFRLGPSAVLQADGQGDHHRHSCGGLAQLRAAHSSGGC